MNRLFMLLLSIGVGTGAGIGVIVALVAGYYSVTPILIAAAIGAVVGVVGSWIAARQIKDTEVDAPSAPSDEPEA